MCNLFGLGDLFSKVEYHDAHIANLNNAFSDLRKEVSKIKSDTCTVHDCATCPLRRGTETLRAENAKLLSEIELLRDGSGPDLEKVLEINMLKAENAKLSAELGKQRALVSHLSAEGQQVEMNNLRYDLARLRCKIEEWERAWNSVSREYDKLFNQDND